MEMIYYYVEMDRDQIYLDKVEIYRNLCARSLIILVLLDPKMIILMCWTRSFEIDVVHDLYAGEMGNLGVWFRSDLYICVDLRFCDYFLFRFGTSIYFTLNSCLTYSIIFFPSWFDLDLGLLLCIIGIFSFFIDIFWIIMKLVGVLIWRLTTKRLVSMCCSQFYSCRSY